MPLTLQFTIRSLVRENPSAIMDDLAWLPFNSLCNGLFLSVSGMLSDKAAYLFGIQTGPSPDATAREALLEQFIDKDRGLSLEQ
jgi:DNA ligase-1